LAKHLVDNPVDAIISSLPYYCNVGVAEAASKGWTHYFDLTEDVEVTRACARSRREPTCVLSRSAAWRRLITSAAAELITHFDELRSVKCAWARCLSIHNCSSTL